MKNELRSFIIKAILFCLPFIVMMSVAIIMDPFKVWFNYEEYYKDNFVTLNREFVCLKLFKRNIDKIKCNSYIYGSSRSQAYKIHEWEKYLGKNDVGFHFDASGEGIYGIYNKIKYINKRKFPIKNALIILDYDAMNSTKNKNGYLYISPPELSGESRLYFYEEFIKANFNFGFMIGYLDYRLFHKFRNYMVNLFNARYDNISDNITGDLYYGYDQMIKKDRKSYYDNLIRKGILYDRSNAISKLEDPASKDEIQLLKGIHDLLVKNNTKYKIVISPLYDQRKLSTERVNLLKNIFGKENIYDFSGKNRYTESIYNYYEESHYRPHVANEIMRIIYK